MSLRILACGQKMCGLFGYFGKVSVAQTDYLHLVAELAERRGPHAFGFVAFNETKKWQYKATKPYSQVKENLDKAETATLVIGHCRLATSGGRNNETDTQPLSFDSTVIAHNGTVPLHDTIAKNHGIKLNTACDSEILAALINRDPSPLPHAINYAVGYAQDLPYVLIGVKNRKPFVARRGHPLYFVQRDGGFYFCSLDPGGGTLFKEGITIIDETFTEQQNMSDHPLNNVEWVDPTTLKANNYNPNTVFKPEMRLLKISILEDGWTQPIVVGHDNVIVDGFHRWTLGSTDKDIQAASNGKVPVVRVRQDAQEHTRLSTIRHNRARGQHGVMAMGSIVRGLIDDGMTKDEIRKRLQMDREEVDRLAEMRGSPDVVGKEFFKRGWKPAKRVSKNTAD